MRPTLQELESISALLLSTDEGGRLLGKELLLRHPQYVTAMRRELMLATFFADSQAVFLDFSQLLKRHFSPKLLGRQIQGFTLFSEALRYVYYPKNSMELYGMVRDHENIRSDYQPLMVKNTGYLLRYLPVGECIREKLPREWRTAQIYYELILSVMPQHAETQQALALLLESYG